MSLRFDIVATPLQGLQLLQKKPLGDQRGYLERVFCSTELQPLLNGRHIAQINHTFTSSRGTVRGMHFQYPPFTETKLVSCIRGEVFDVAIDLRSDSATFLHWHAEILSGDNHQTLVIPDGFAHGFQTLTEDCEMLYLHTAEYRADAEGGINALDPRVGIRWPLPVAERSARDAAHAPLAHDFTGVAA